MPKKIDMLDKKIGKLTVIERMGPRLRNNYNNKTDIYWKCMCECGGMKEVPTSALTGNNTKSCGCMIAENARRTIKFAHEANKLPEGQASLNNLIYTYKKIAKDRNHNWDLTEKEAHKLFIGNCYYCDCVPKQLQYMSKKFNGQLLYNGIDRIDNKKGYEKNNTVSCCGICNWMKRDLSKSKFIIHVNKIVKIHSKEEE